MNRNAISILRTSLISLLVIVIAGYSLFQAQKLIRGPVIDIYTPENGATYNQTLIEIEGRARNIAYLNLNDRPIFTDKNGYFSEKLLLSPGYNIIKLDARDKFKNYTEKRLEIILKEY
ncbi:MAG: hypothetical protein AB201_02825 [Parcubacteria bacterium C7867-006]|nr:MAG: hypothetical protein AB201_02825 [Parcubacteria bacterium C7867-006]